MNVQEDRETATGYEKVQTINGRLTTEKYDNQDKSGEYSVIVASRFMHRGRRQRRRRWTR